MTDSKLKVDVASEFSQTDDSSDSTESGYINANFAEYLEALMKEKKVKKSQLIKNSGISQIYAYQIISGKKNADRNKILCFAISMGLTTYETNMLLYLADKSKLYPRFYRDSLIISGLQNHLSVFEIDNLLYEAGEKALINYAPVG